MLQEKAYKLMYHIHWHIPNRVLYTHYWDNITLEDIRNANEDTLKAMNSQDNTLFVIVDMQGATGFAANAEAAIKTTSVLRHPNMGWLVAIQTPVILLPMFNILFPIAARATGVRLKRVNTLAEAEEFILLHAPDLAGRFPILEAEGE